MATEENKILPYLCYASFFAVCLAIIPWIAAFLSQSINSDIAYLTLSAGRMLGGVAMSEGYYDTNPPLSIIVQIPAILLTKLTPIPLYYATSIYSLSLLGLSLLATSLLLKNFKDLKVDQRYIILCIYLATNTLTLGYDFGQKDHLLGMALFPLVLAQILMTQRIKFNTVLKWSVIIAGSFFILLKPHYGVIPAAIFIHRAIIQRRLSVIFDLDFLWLAGMAIGYIGVIFLLFPDFVSTILPDVLKFYASDISTKVVYTGIILMLQAIVPLFICQLFFKKPPPLISVFSIIAVLCFVPFILQGKGWAYHALAANYFFYGAAGLLLSHIITISLAHPAFKNIKPFAGFIIVISLLFWLISNNYATQPHNAPTHSSYKNSGFVKIINECEGDCSFLVLHDTINISKELSVYTGKQHASRLPYLWFVTHLIHAENKLSKNIKSKLSPEELNLAVNKYTTIMAEDFKKYNPDIVFIGHVPNPALKDTLFNARAYLLENNPELFEPIWDNYKLDKTIMVDRIEYMFPKFPGEDLIRYDIYKKKKKEITNNE